MQGSCRRYITSRMLCFVRRTLDRVLSEYSCESGVVWVLGFVLFLYPITRGSEPAPRETAASVAPSRAGPRSNFNLVALQCPDPRDSPGRRTTPLRWLRQRPPHPMTTIPTARPPWGQFFFTFAPPKPAHISTLSYMLASVACSKACYGLCVFACTLGVRVRL